MEHGQDTEIH